MTAIPDEKSCCAKCGVEFRCGVTAGEESCWCMALPPLLEVPAKSMSNNAACYCPRCLKAVLTSAAA